MVTIEEVRNAREEYISLQVSILKGIRHNQNIIATAGENIQYQLAAAESDPASVQIFHHRANRFHLRAVGAQKSIETWLQELRRAREKLSELEEQFFTEQLEASTTGLNEVDDALRRFVEATTELKSPETASITPAQ